MYHGKFQFGINLNIIKESDFRLIMFVVLKFKQNLELVHIVKRYQSVKIHKYQYCIQDKY